MTLRDSLSCVFCVCVARSSSSAGDNYFAMSHGVDGAWRAVKRSVALFFLLSTFSLLAERTQIRRLAFMYRKLVFVFKFRRFTSDPPHPRADLSKQGSKKLRQGHPVLP